ncbi:MAG: DinB family protein, partial [Gemmatimonadota bacterium]
MLKPETHERFVAPVEVHAQVDALTASTRDFIATLDGLSAAQWNYRPSPEAWSIKETAEHTAVVLHGIGRLFTTKLLTMPLAADDPGRRIGDGDLTRLMADRSRAFEAPDMVKPKGRWATREEFIAAFSSSTESLVAWAREHAAVLRTVGAPHPIFGPIDAVQWLEFVAA